MYTHESAANHQSRALLTFCEAFGEARLLAVPESTKVQSHHRPSVAVFH